MKNRLFDLFRSSVIPLEFVFLPQLFVFTSPYLLAPCCPCSNYSFFMCECVCVFKKILYTIYCKVLFCLLHIAVARNPNMPINSHCSEASLQNKVPTYQIVMSNLGQTNLLGTSTPANPWTLWMCARLRTAWEWIFMIFQDRSLPEKGMCSYIETAANPNQIHCNNKNASH